MTIDTTFDFRSDSEGPDPDKHSPTLRRYHQLLWSKPLPSGERFELSTTTPGAYLHHRSALGEFFLSSDLGVPTFTNWASMSPITSQLPDEEHEAFLHRAYTIGGSMVFPARQVDRQWTINQARGCTRSISDRLDLTLECIRRHYTGLESPMSGPLARYADFFALFGDFQGYVSFFLLDDLVTDDRAVRFFLPWEDFASPAVPGDLAAYLTYRQRSIEFVDARNRRIELLGL